MAEMILRLRDVRQRVGLSRSSLYARMASGDFPRPIALGEGARARGWLSSEIDAWLTAQVERSRRDAA